MNLVVLGLTITSSWGNGHATTYRALLRAMAARGHRITFLERDVPWYVSARDMAEPPFAKTILYATLDDLKDRHASTLREADLVLVGSYVPEGVAVADWALGTARGPVMFYDIDTPVTLAKLDEGDHEYLEPALVPRFDAYLSFSGGASLHRLESEFGAKRAVWLPCAVDPDLYAPLDVEPTLDMTYMGTYSPDRQPPLERLMLEPARRWPEGRFTVAGPQFPDDIVWPANVARIEHLPPSEHRAFYASGRFTLNVTRAAMVAMGHSPSVRLFEAAACGIPIISDPWPGLDETFTLGEEILVAEGPEDTLRYLRETSESDRKELGARARARVLRDHTADARAQTVEETFRAVSAAGLTQKI